MTKNIIRFAVLLMAGAMIFTSCGKKDPDKQGGKDKENTEDVTKASVQIILDGQFTDWDQITPEVAGKDDFIDMIKASSSDPIRVIKTTSDINYVYFYAEISCDALPQTSICAEWGDSWNGAAGYKGDDKNDGISTGLPPFNLFFDPDGDELTGFYTYAGTDGQAAIPGLGCEMCAQNLMFFNPDTKKLGIAWNQTNIGPSQITNADGSVSAYNYHGTFFQDWPDTVIPQYGWQNGAGDGKGDNVAPRKENIFSQLVSGWIKVEFAFDKNDIVNLGDNDEEFAWGVCFRNGDDFLQDIGPVHAKYGE